MASPRRTRASGRGFPTRPPASAETAGRPGPPLRAFSTRTPSTPDIAARATAAGIGRCGGVLCSAWRGVVCSVCGDRPRLSRWVPAFAGTTICGKKTRHRCPRHTSTRCFVWEPATPAIPRQRASLSRAPIAAEAAPTQSDAAPTRARCDGIAASPPTVVPAKEGTQRLRRQDARAAISSCSGSPTTNPHRPLPVPVPLAAMSGVEGVRAEEARRGPAWTARRLRRGTEAESKTPARTPGSAAAKPLDTSRVAALLSQGTT
ncbi:hypothetical protein FHS47_000972 [Lutibacter sp. SG786]|nr:hypothetical protein [Luteibacter sp. SG786]